MLDKMVRLLIAEYGDMAVRGAIARIATTGRVPNVAWRINREAVELAGYWPASTLRIARIKVASRVLGIRLVEAKNWVEANFAQQGSGIPLRS